MSTRALMSSVSYPKGAGLGQGTSIASVAS